MHAARIRLQQPEREASMTAKASQLHGVLVLDKPKGPTSAGCLAQIKRILGQKKIGHAGTLDPMARGVLLVLLGQATKLAGALTEGGKIYSGKLKLGLATDTYDLEGKVVREAPYEHLTPEAVAAAVSEWATLTMQDVPPYSAAKHQGKPLYQLSREGKETPLKSKSISISRAEVLGMDLPWVDFRVECGPGTYIRSLVHSLGIRLECGATMTELTREFSHPFRLEQAFGLDQVLDEPELLATRVVPLPAALPHWPKLAISSRLAGQVKNGIPVGACDTGAAETPPAGQRALFLDPDGGPLALAEVRLVDGKPVWAIVRGLWQS